MSVRLHGMINMTLMLVAMVIAIVAAFLASWVWGVVYVVVCAAAYGITIFVFCAKCPCQDCCVHVLPAVLAKALTNRQPGPYTGADLVAVSVGLLLLIVLPLVWLWHYPVLLVAYVVLFAVALVQIRAAICRVCAHNFCPLRAARDSG
jgi:hypothetical protein